MKARSSKKIAATSLIALVSLLTSTACNSLLERVGLGSIARRIVATPGGPFIEVSPTPVPANLTTAALVKLRSKLRVGIRFDAPPLASVNKAGEIEGLDADIAREFARRWLGSEANVEFVQVTSTSAPRRLANRELDLALGGLAVVRASEKDVDYSLPYFTDGEAVLIRTNSYADFASMAQKDVLYIDGQSLPALSAGQIASNITVTFRSEVSYANAVQALLDGKTEGVIGRWRRFVLLAQRDPAFSILTVLQSDPVAIMLPQSDTQWEALVNLTLSAMIADGFYAKAYERWFGVPPQPAYAIPQPAPPGLAQLVDERIANNVLDRIKANNAVRVGYVPRAAPASSLVGLDINAQPAGFEVELIAEVAQRLQPGAAVNYTPLADNQVTQALDNGSVDVVIGGLQQTSANVLNWSFSEATYAGSGSVISGTASINLAAPVGFALPMNDSAYRDAVNAALQDMRGDGSYDLIRTKWLGG
jgi:polar amino acid transport system substrate-binding protein